MLPKIDVPVYELTLPSNGKKIKYRPFLVKEEKILLMAAQSKDPVEIKNAITQIIGNCVLNENYDVETAPMFDIEYLLLHIRMQSVGNKIPLVYTCKTMIDDPRAMDKDSAIKISCDTPFDYVIDLEHLKIEGKRNPPKQLTIGSLILTMRYPSYAAVQAIDPNDKYSTKILESAVESVFDGTNNFVLDEATEADRSDFFESMTSEQFKMIEDWLKDLPQYVVEDEHTCEVCGTKHNIRIERLLDFF